MRIYKDDITSRQDFYEYYILNKYFKKNIMLIIFV